MNARGDAGKPADRAPGFSDRARGVLPAPDFTDPPTAELFRSLRPVAAAAFAAIAERQGAEQQEGPTAA